MGTQKVNFDNAVTYHYDAFPPPALDTNRYVDELLAATAAISRYDQMLKQLHNSEILLAPLRNREAVISSRIEGTISTMDEILEYEANDKDDASNPQQVRQDVIETILYQRALKNAQTAMQDGHPLSPGLVRTLHQQLLSIGRGARKAPGSFKQEQNYLADNRTKQILFVPISPERLTDGLERLFAYLRSSKDPILVKAALIHLEFEALHPFQDGNGRIGRMLITLYLWHAGIISAPHFYISGFFETHKDEYIDTMRNVSAHGDWHGWITFFLQAVAEQAVKNLQIAESIQELYTNMKVKFADILSSKWSGQALDFVFTNPVFRNNTFTSRSGIPAPTANKFARTLLQHQLLAVKQGAAGRRAALYSFEPLMELVRV